MYLVPAEKSLSWQQCDRLRVDYARFTHPVPAVKDTTVSRMGPSS